MSSSLIMFAPIVTMATTKNAAGAVFRDNLLAILALRFRSLRHKTGEAAYCA
jgi:hypothetical protein